MDTHVCMLYFSEIKIKATGARGGRKNPSPSLSQILKSSAISLRFYLLVTNYPTFLLLKLRKGNAKPLHKCSTLDQQEQNNSRFL